MTKVARTAILDAVLVTRQAQVTAPALDPTRAWSRYLVTHVEWTPETQATATVGGFHTHVPDPACPRPRRRAGALGR